MSLLSVAHEAPVRSSLAASALRSVARRLIAWRIRRANRQAMLGLLEMEAWRLDDLGLSIDAVSNALDARH